MLARFGNVQPSFKPISLSCWKAIIFFIASKVGTTYLLLYHNYMSIVKTCNFFLPEFEKMKSYIYRVQTTNAGRDCSKSGIICSFRCMKKLYFSRPRESSKSNIWQEFAIIIQCPACMILGCVFITAKVSLSRVEI